MNLYRKLRQKILIFLARSDFNEIMKWSSIRRLNINEKEECKTILYIMNDECESDFTRTLALEKLKDKKDQEEVKKYIIDLGVKCSNPIKTDNIMLLTNAILSIGEDINTSEGQNALLNIGNNVLEYKSYLKRNLLLSAVVTAIDINTSEGRDFIEHISKLKKSDNRDNPDTMLFLMYDNGEGLMINPNDFVNKMATNRLEEFKTRNKERPEIHSSVSPINTKEQPKNS